MISAAFADQTNEISKTTATAETLKTLVASFTFRNPGKATVGAAAVEEEDAQNKNSMIAAGSLQSIMGGTKKVKFC